MKKEEFEGRDVNSDEWRRKGLKRTKTKRARK